MTERSAFGDIFLATLAGISAYAVFTTSFSPASWAVVALCAWLGVATLRGRPPRLPDQMLSPAPDS